MNKKKEIYNSEFEDFEKDVNFISKQYRERNKNWDFDFGKKDYYPYSGNNYMFNGKDIKEYLKILKLKKNFLEIMFKKIKTETYEHHEELHKIYKNEEIK